MTCGQAKSSFSPYLDGMLTGAQMRVLAEHLDACPECHRQYRQLCRSQEMLVALGRPQPPSDLNLRLRVAASHQLALARRSRWEGLALRFENAVNTYIIPACAGLAAAVLVFGLLMGFFALPPQLEAANDVPLMVYTPPSLKASAYQLGPTTINENSLIVMAYINENGRVDDYQVLSAPRDANDLLPQVKNILIFTEFQPAMTMGRPTAGRAVLAFTPSPADHMPKLERIKSIGRGV